MTAGVGLPHPVDNTHEIARHHNAEARIVHADADCIVAAHGRALLEVDQRSLVSLPGADVFLDSQYSTARASRKRAIPAGQQGC
ncbi:SAM-dependent methyltransferase [Amycolatopsis sulphurea]|uniref:SAM-dependent methyltransferase n=1 Tax=Amycolatopsis sulphurea TaxID=76022 RepID=UPI001FE2734D|nr:SAM-dependent methyltransferase [Amycolatopsis sulphurea]